MIQHMRIANDVDVLVEVLILLYLRESCFKSEVEQGSCDVDHSREYSHGLFD